ncbi:uracil-DNA glycosylase [Mangrovibrevibacter kandeliae]|uniref:uracil-DNA glycosylase n=1 Tax=Mangrovibrevibacter kandeliae TaxID=2968473 RepID=UPI002117EBB0|nr:uracil-DNA glycosylase [Aurantimonas sp. CSK15Z-1]MCQ8781128.1 uracil-DNA glycosylase [Aurantimonas sp. CSK15Z-1]
MTVRADAAAPAALPVEPDRDCPLCPRLVDFRESWRTKEPAWHNAPVQSFLPAEGPDAVRLLIAGLAPGLRGANRTGRPFTGDYAGDLLYATLHKFGFANGRFDARPDDGLALYGTAIVNSVRCVPPENKPTPAEINTCRQFLAPNIRAFANLQVIVTLGRIAHDSTLRALGVRLKDAAFGHGAEHEVAGFSLIASYHCSRYNTNTGVLTTAMFEAVFARAAERLQTPR